MTKLLLKKTRSRRLVQLTMTSSEASMLLKVMVMTNQLLLRRLRLKLTLKPQLKKLPMQIKSQREDGKTKETAITEVEVVVKEGVEAVEKEEEVVVVEEEEETQMLTMKVSKRL